MPLKRDLLIDRIKELSQAIGVSPTKALQESGAGKDFVANLKKGQSPSVDKIEMVAQYFGVSVDYLLGSEKQNKLPDNADELIGEILKNKSNMAVVMGRGGNRKVIEVPEGAEDLIQSVIDTFKKRDK